MRLSIDLERINRLSRLVAFVTVAGLLLIIVASIVFNRIVLQRLWWHFMTPWLL